MGPLPVPLPNLVPELDTARLPSFSIYTCTVGAGWGCFSSCPWSQRRPEEAAEIQRVK